MAWNSAYGSVIDFDITILPPAHILAAEFAAFGLQVKSFREPLRRSIRQVVAPHIRLAFEVGGIPTWAPLAESTVGIKDKLGYPPDKLVRTGRLKKVAGQINSWAIDRESATFANLQDADYGGFHLSGTQFMPQRDFLSTVESDADAIAEIFGDWIIERFERRGLDVPDEFSSTESVNA